MRRSPSTSGCSWWGRSACCSRSRARSAPCPASGPPASTLPRPGAPADAAARARQARARGRAVDRDGIRRLLPVAPDGAPRCRRAPQAAGSRPRLAHGNRRVAARAGGLEPRPRRPGAAARPRRAGSGARPDRRRRRRRRSLVKVTEVADRSARLLDEVERAVVGKREALELVLLGLLADGHVLIEDFPGLAKTLMARSFAQATGLGFGRIQFTPDLMPSDVTGSSIYNQRTADFEFRPGPDLHEPPPRRRDQPRPAEDAGGAARGDAGAPGDERGPDTPAGAAVPRARDPEPDRARGHLPPARGTARPVPAADLGRLPVPRARARNPRAAARPPRRRGRARPGRGHAETPRDAAGARGRLRRREPRLLHRRRRPGDARRRQRPGRREPAWDARDPEARPRAERRSTAATSSSRTTSRRWPARRSRTGSRSDPSSGCSRCAPRTSSPSGSRPYRPRPRKSGDPGGARRGSPPTLCSAASP